MDHDSHSMYFGVLAPTRGSRYTLNHVHITKAVAKGAMGAVAPSSAESLILPLKRRNLSEF